MDNDLLAMLNALDVPEGRRDEYVRSPFGWPGAKSRSIDEILPKLPYRPRYCEPFGGSGKILLARHESPYEVFNDRFSGVTLFFRLVRHPETCNQLLSRLDQILHSREEFIWCRDTWKNCENEIERAARWFYSVRMSFGSQGTNFGRSKNSTMLIKAFQNSLTLFPDTSKRMRNVLIENLDWRMILKDYDHPDMVWYMDPPYYHTAKGQYEFEFTDEDHMELLERIQQLEGFVAISSYPNELYAKYSWDDIHTWQVHSTALGQSFQEENNQAGKEHILARVPATECLYIKEAA